MNRSCVAALAALVGVSLMTPAGHATLVTYSGPGGALVDHGPNDGDIGYAWFDIDISGTGGTVDAMRSITVTGLQHAYMGDLGLYLYGPDDTVFSEITSPPIERGPNFNGTYTFVIDSTKQTVDEAIVGKTTTYDLPSGTYAISRYGNVRSNFAEVNGQSLDGRWTLEIRDFSRPDTGTLGGWSFTADATVPEPTSIAMLGAAGVLLRRRFR